MKRIVCCLFAIVSVFVCRAQVDGQDGYVSKKQVAVYVTDCDVDDAVKKVVQTKVISTLTHSAKYRVLERNADFLKAIMQDREHEMSGEVKESQIAAIGKQFGAKFIFVADIAEAYDGMFISGRLVNVESSVIEGTDEELIIEPNIGKVMKAAEKVANGVIGQGKSNSQGTSAFTGGSTSASNGNTRTFNVNGVTFEMVRVEGGSFQMGSYSGSNNEQPVHTETVQTFYIGKTEVTQRLWSAVMGSNPSNFRGDNLPVENVTWYDCQEFAERLSRLTGCVFRLPTEAEWEYAARGGNKSRGFEYSGSGDLGRVAWYDANSSNMTHPVGQKFDNELGIYDMSGNVWEWCADLYSNDYSSPRNSSYRVIRGGGWSSTATICRVAIRSCNSPGFRFRILGLRLAL